MKLRYFIEQGAFVFRYRVLLSIASFFRKTYFRILGMKIGKTTTLPSVRITWPHQVSIGENCNLEKDIFFKYDGIWKEGPSIIIEDNVFIGANCEFNITRGIVVGKESMIASGCKFIDHNHRVERLPKSERGQDLEEEIHLGYDVWLGFNVTVLMGVSIGDSAIVAAGAVVNKSIPANEIWAGIPARKIGERKIVKDSQANYVVV